MTTITARGGAVCVLGASLLLASILSGCGGGASAPTPPATATPALPAPAATAGVVQKSRTKPPLPLTSGPVDGSAYLIVSVGTILVAGTESQGILVSVDQGRRWSRMNQGLPSALSVPAIAVAPHGARLFAVVSGAIYSAVPRLPLAWARWGLALPHGSNPEAIAYWPATHAVLVGDGSGALYATSGPAAPWEAADSGLPVGLQAVITLLVRPGVSYAGLTNGLASSTDGTRWTLDPSFGAHQVSALAALPDGGLAAALDSGGLAVRLGAKTPWTFAAPAALGLPAGARVLSVAYDAAGHSLFLGTLANGMRQLAGFRPPARIFTGVGSGNPVNGILPAGHWLYAATNAGILRLPK